MIGIMFVFGLCIYAIPKIARESGNKAPAITDWDLYLKDQLSGVPVADRRRRHYVGYYSQKETGLS